MTISLSRFRCTSRLLSLIAVFMLLAALGLCMPSGADAFLGGLFGKKKAESSKDNAETGVVQPAPAFKPVPVPGAVKEMGLPDASLDSGDSGEAVTGKEADVVNGVLFLDDIKTEDLVDGPVVEGDAPIFTGGEDGTGKEGSERFGVHKGAEDTEPVVFFELAPEEEIEEALPDLELEDLLFGASTDEALLRLARLFTARGELKKGGRTYSRLIEDFPASTVRFDAFYELGYLRYRENRLSEARLLLEYVVKSRTAAITLKDPARTLLEEIESIYERGTKKSGHISIGALLPLGGKYTKMGNAALRGILLATGAFEADGVAVDVYVRDTGATAFGAKAAIEELVNGKRVRALIGPMLSSTATEAAQYAQNKQTPIIALSQRDGLTDVGNFVYRNSLLPGRQAALVASYAYHTLGNRTFVMLYPRSRYGATLARAFAAEVERLGGVVINKRSYKPGSNDLNEELRDLFIIEEEETAKGRRVIKEFNPTIVADALYMPDYYQTVSMVVPYLKYFNIDGLQLLGSNGWNSPKLVTAGGRGVRGAIFADGFFSGTKRVSTIDFIKRYTEMYGSLPGVIESQAYDATRLLLAALSKREYEWMDRATLRKDLESTSGVTGSIGGISIEEGGEVGKELFLLRVERKGIVEVEVDETVRLGAKHEEEGVQAISGQGPGSSDTQSEEDGLWD